MISRRIVLNSISFAISAIVMPPVCHGQILSEGCYLHSSVSDSLLGGRDFMAASVADQALITTSGDKDLDHYLGRALVRLADQFGVYPGFGFFNDGASLNAFASPETHPQMATVGTKGTVLYGINLFNRMLKASDDQGIAILAVCAHEFAHIYQYNTEYYKQLRDLALQLSPKTPVKLVELHADYLAGYFIGMRKAEHSELKLWAAGAVINKFGDTNFGSPNHHGTSAQRVSAIQEGFDFGYSGKHDMQAAASSGAQFIVKMFS